MPNPVSCVCFPLASVLFVEFWVLSENHTSCFRLQPVWSILELVSHAFRDLAKGAQRLQLIIFIHDVQSWLLEILSKRIKRHQNVRNAMNTKKPYLFIARSTLPALVLVSRFYSSIHASAMCTRRSISLVREYDSATVASSRADHLVALAIVRLLSQTVFIMVHRWTREEREHLFFWGPGAFCKWPLATLHVAPLSTVSRPWKTKTLVWCLKTGPWLRPSLILQYAYRVNNKTGTTQFHCKYVRNSSVTLHDIWCSF